MSDHPDEVIALELEFAWAGHVLLPAMSTVRIFAFALAAALGLAALVAPAAVAAEPQSVLKPTPVGSGQCEYSQPSRGAAYAQVAVRNTTCVLAKDVAAGSFSAKGKPYSSHGFACRAEPEGKGSPWASAWGGTYYAYSCVRGAAKAVAFNWGPDYTYAGDGLLTTPTTSARLLPTPLGDGDCYALENADHSVEAQIAIEDTDCSVADVVIKGADTARGRPYSSDGFSCSATVEGAGSKWASAWGGTYYAYNCKHASEQIAFNWGVDYTY